MLKKCLLVSGMAVLAVSPAFAADKADVPASAPAPAAAAAAAPSEDAGLKAAFDKFSAAWAAGDAKARAEAFTEDATLINPFGIAASGRAEIIKLFEGENQTIAKGTTHSFSNLKAVYKNGLALVDTDSLIAGIKTPKGDAAPDLKLHVSGVMVKGTKGEWLFLSARPVIYAAMPGMPAKAEAKPEMKAEAKK